MIILSFMTSIVNYNLAQKQLNSQLACKAIMARYVRGGVEGGGGNIVKVTGGQ
jgi:branched-subunit amino acid aminotransferase/4-amino-4-deoxychorismate lyase